MGGSSNRIQNRWKRSAGILHVGLVYFPRLSGYYRQCSFTGHATHGPCRLSTAIEKPIGTDCYFTCIAVLCGWDVSASLTPRSQVGETPRSQWTSGDFNGLKWRLL